LGDDQKPGRDDGNSGQNNRDQKKRFAPAERVGGGNEHSHRDRIHDQYSLPENFDDRRGDEEEEQGNENRPDAATFPRA
jgi:hypothetical protein